MERECSHVGYKECDKIRRYMIKHRILHMYFRYQFTFTETQNVVWRHNLVEGVLKNSTYMYVH